MCPLARQAIKSLVKDHRYDYIATGSLISIKRNVKDILIPSEERKIERTRRNYEIDFLLARRNKICPIEVKSSGYKTHTSRDAFSQKFSDQILHKYLVYTKDLGKDADIICLPIYMVPFL